MLRGLPVAGIRQGTGDCRVHLVMDDRDATAKAVLAAGGTVIEEPHEVGDPARAEATLARAGHPRTRRTAAWRPSTTPFGVELSIIARA